VILLDQTDFKQKHEQASEYAVTIAVFSRIANVTDGYLTDGFPIEVVGKWMLAVRFTYFTSADFMATDKGLVMSLRA